ncbi:hypothetical protein BC835DRAFT_1234867, partial [Cytidiella melzeri]
DRFHTKGFRTQAVRVELDNWSVENVGMLVDAEMDQLKEVMTAPTKNLSEEDLLTLDLRDLATKTQVKAPILWKILYGASTTPTQIEQNTYKDPTAPIVMMVSMCSYSQSQRCCLLQRFNSAYFKASGLAARANDTTHLYGITMSHLWVYQLIDRLSEDARQRMFANILRFPFRVSQDNLNL